MKSDRFDGTPRGYLFQGVNLRGGGACSRPFLPGPPNTALQRTRAAVSLQSVPSELSTSGRRRAPLSLRPLGGGSVIEARL